MKKAKQDSKCKTQDSKKIAAPAARNDSKPGEYQVIDITKIKPSKENYRKTVNLKGLEELTDSIRSKGVLQPINVRPAKGNGSFEIVAGHRRHTAAKDAGLKQIPCILKDYTDAEALEIQVIENSQREDVNPMEEAIGFKKLLDMGQHTPETLAMKLGKSLSYVFGRLSLAKLSGEVQKAVLNEKISLGHALILTRLRQTSEQKEMLQAILQQGWSVRDAADQLEDFSHDIKNAVFDTKSCDACPYLSKNQTVLFPELKKTGECMDRGCFAKKTMDFYKAFLDEKKKQGFKVITERKEVVPLHNSSNAIEIYHPDTGHYSNVPKRYKSECVKCTEHHAYFLYEEDAYRGKRIRFGEMCTNKKCLDAMNNPKGDRAEDREESSESGSGRISPYTIAAHALACRDRFLKAELPARVEASDVLQKRLLVYNLLLKYGDYEEMNAVVRMVNPKFKDEGFHDRDWDGWYEVAQGIAVAKLVEAIQQILIASIQGTDPLALLRMTPEAGIDMTRDFGPDEEFLNSKTKAELIKFIGTHKLTVEVKESGKKGDIVKAILTQNLKGKLTKELKECVEMRRDAEART